MCTTASVPSVGGVVSISTARGAPQRVAWPTALVAVAITVYERACPSASPRARIAGRGAPRWPSDGSAVAPPEAAAAAPPGVTDVTVSLSAYATACNPTAPPSMAAEKSSASECVACCACAPPASVASGDVALVATTPPPPPPPPPPPEPTQTGASARTSVYVELAVSPAPLVHDRCTRSCRWSAAQPAGRSGRVGSGLVSSTVERRPLGSATPVRPLQSLRHVDRLACPESTSAVVGVPYERTRTVAAATPVSASAHAGTTPSLAIVRPTKRAGSPVVGSVPATSWSESAAEPARKRSATVGGVKSTRIGADVSVACVPARLVARSCSR